MTGAEVLDIGRDAIWLTILIGTPVLVVSLVVGLVISLFQTLTQIQEQTLAFAPKAVAIFLALIVFLPFMASLLGNFAQELFARIAAY
jgi:flagellar biosynthetic protein FliQ